MARPIAILFTLAAAFAQTPAPQSASSGDVAFTASLRTRVESWDWFQGAANNDYTFVGSIARFGLAQSTDKFDWQLEFAAPFLLGLPDNAVAPGAQGQLGFGASYFVANNRNENAAMVFPKQGFFRWKSLGGRQGQALKIGRMEFLDGSEFTPADPTLAALERDRISQRLIGNFGFSDVGRSLDGAQYGLTAHKLKLTLLAARPTRGVFQVDGWGEVKVNLFFGSLAGEVKRKRSAGAWRVFAVGYQDLRDHVVKTDSRPVAVRTADTGHINLGTYGADYLHLAQTRAGALDFLAWGLVQTGAWGNQSQRAAAFALEAGYQAALLPRLRPWIRVGYDYGSGDGNPNDRTHGTFFQILPTPRVYARFPFFNMMNNRDAFGELVLRPGKKLAVRSDIHSLSLANRNDLWYSGGGVYQPWTFGYTGRPSNSHTGFANLYDISADYTANAHFSLGLYLGHAAGKSVIDAIYPQGKNGNLGYLELAFKL